MRSMTETMVATVIGFVLTGAMVEFSLATLWATDKTLSADTLTRGGRAGLDEVLYQTRSANTVADNATVNGTTYTTNASTLVLTTPSYSATATGDFRIAGQTDTVIFHYDSGSQQIKETIVPGTGSSRPARTGFVVARNVSGFSLKYTVRDSFTAPSTGSTTAYTLSKSAASGATPKALVNGTPVTATVTGTSLTISGATPDAGANVQVYYEVTPTNGSTGTSGTNPAESAVGVTVTLQMATAGGRYNANQTYSIDGSARLRNLRS